MEIELMDDNKEINSLPKKALTKILSCIPQSERQEKRLVCQLWNQIIWNDIPVHVKITNDNYERTFRCQNAKIVTLQNFNREFRQQALFASSAKTLIVKGNVLSCNFVKLLKQCVKVETLQFIGLKQVVAVENSELINVPDLKTLEVVVRIDQDTFTGGEFILLNVLKRANFRNLENVVVSTTSWVNASDDEDMDEEDSDASNDSSLETFQSTAVNIPAEISMRTNSAVLEQEFSASRISDADDEIDQGVDDATGQVLVTQGANESTAAEITTVESLENSMPGGNSTFPEANNSDLVSTTSQPPLDRPRAVYVDASSGSTESNSRSNSTYSRIGFAEFEFATYLYNNPTVQMQMHTSSNLQRLLDDQPSSRPPQYATTSNYVALPSTASTRSTAFFDVLMRAGHLKSLNVKTRPDFVCFGNIGSYAKEALEKLQIENIDYSFGRSQKLSSEYLLLANQNGIKRLRINCLDDLWDSIMTACNNSQSSMEELDMKILSLSEEPINLAPLSSCKKLKVLKVFHFFEKLSLEHLPTSITKLVLNGPVRKSDLTSFTVRLEKLSDFTLILNTNVLDKVDIELFKRFVQMPHIKKIGFIQSQIDVPKIEEYCQNHKLKIVIQGPRELKEPFNLGSTIQYIMIHIPKPISDYSSTFTNQR